MNRSLTFLNNYLGCERPKDRLYTALDLFEKPELIETVQHKSGIYIIMSPTQKFIYPKGSSPIIYIGTSNDLHRRLKEHIKYYGIAVEHWKDHTRWIYSRYNYIIAFKGKVYYMLTQRRETNRSLFAMNIESTNGLKGQQANSPGQRPGYFGTVMKSASQGQKQIKTINAFALSGRNNYTT